jgi:hypothetical protein
MTDITDITVLSSAVTHTVAAALLRCRPRARRRSTRDRGAVSLEQVLWFVAAGVSVAVVAAILWGRIREEATTPIEAPTAP